MQLASKMRYIAAQFDAFLENDLWKTNAAHANAMAKRLSQGIVQAKHARIAWTPDTNEVFCILEKSLAEQLKQKRLRFIRGILPAQNRP